MQLYHKVLFAENVVQLLRVHTALAKDLPFAIEQPITTCISSSKRSDSSGLLRHLPLDEHIFSLSLALTLVLSLSDTHARTRVRTHTHTK